MAEYNINSTVSSDLANAMTKFSVDSQQTDAASDQKETTWIDEKFSDYLGYYKDPKTPEITAVINAFARWTVGKGYKADTQTTKILDNIRGFGKDTFNTILENATIVGKLGGNFYAEIIRDKNKIPINLKPLDPSVMKHVVDNKGILIRFEQVSKIGGKSNKRFKPEDIFYLCRNRVADEIHGMGIAQKLKDVIDAKNEVFIDMRTLMHRHVIPQWKFKLKTDNTTEIAAYKAKMDKAVGAGENIYEPFDVAEGEIMAVAPNATLNPMAWITYLDNYFYEMAGVPKIILGGSGEFTEASAKIAYLAFQQTIEEEQLFIEEQIGMQLGMSIELQFPASLENELLSDNKKDGAVNIDASETTAGEGQ